DEKFAVICCNCRRASAGQRPSFQGEEERIRAGVHGRKFPGARTKPFFLSPPMLFRYRWDLFSGNNEKSLRKRPQTMVQLLNIRTESSAMDCWVFQAIGGRTVHVQNQDRTNKSSSNIHVL
ncbi:hypothetical protein PspLS_00193, partial [Pyricularia sp. CBS 133598]